jgi:hypothetical protein
VSEVLEIVSRLEQGVGTLTLEGDRIRYSVPSGDIEARGLLAELRKHRDGLKEILRRRAEESRKWPPISLYAEQRFCLQHARLFPFIGHKVRTPNGSGTLLQVFADRVTVLLDCELSRCSFFAPDQIEPISWASPK